MSTVEENSLEYHSTLRDTLLRVSECVAGLSNSLAGNFQDRDFGRSGKLEAEDNEGEIMQQRDGAGFGTVNSRWIQTLDNHSNNMRYLIERYNEEGRRDYQQAEAPYVSDLSGIFQEMKDNRQKVIQKVRHIEKRLVQFPDIGAVPESAINHGTIFSSIATRSNEKSELALLRCEHEKEIASLRKRVEEIFAKLKKVQDEIIQMSQHYQDEMQSRVEIVESMHKQVIRSRDQMYSMNYKIGKIVKRLSSYVMDANLQIVLTMSELSKDSNLESPPFMSFQEYATLKRGNENLQTRADELLRSVEKERSKREAMAAELLQIEERRVVLQSKLKETNLRLQKVTVQLSLAPTEEEVESLKTTIRALQNAAARAQFSPISTVSESETQPVQNDSNSDSPRIKTIVRQPITEASSDRSVEASAPSTNPEDGNRTPSSMVTGSWSSLPIVEGAAQDDAQPASLARAASLGQDPDHLLHISLRTISQDPFLDVVDEHLAVSGDTSDPATHSADSDVNLKSATSATAVTMDAPDGAKQIQYQVPDDKSNRTESEYHVSLEPDSSAADVFAVNTKQCREELCENSKSSTDTTLEMGSSNGLAVQRSMEAVLHPPPGSPKGSEASTTLDYVYDRRLFKHVLRCVQVSSRRFHDILLDLAAVVRSKLAAQDGSAEQAIASPSGRVLRVGPRTDDGPGPGRGRRLSVCDLLTSDLRHFAPSKVAGAGEAIRRASMQMRDGPRQALTGKRFSRYDAASRIQLSWLRRSRVRHMDDMARALDQAYTVDTVLFLLEKDEEWNERQLSFARRQLEALKTLASDDQVRAENRQLKERCERESSRCRRLEAELVAMASNRAELEAQVRQLETASLNGLRESVLAAAEIRGSENKGIIQDGGSQSVEIRAGLQAIMNDLTHSIATLSDLVRRDTAKVYITAPAGISNAIGDTLASAVQLSGQDLSARRHSPVAGQSTVSIRLDSGGAEGASLFRANLRLSAATQTEPETVTVTVPALEPTNRHLDAQVSEMAKSEMAESDKAKTGRGAARRRSRMDEAVGAELSRLREAGRSIAESHAKFEAFVRFYVPVLYVQVEDAVTALADVVKQARMAATEEGVGAWTGMQEAEVTDRLLALVDETVETLDDEGRLRAQRRVDQDFESVRISSLALQGLFSPRTPPAPKPANSNAARAGRKARNLTNVPQLRVGQSGSTTTGQISVREVGKSGDLTSARNFDTLPPISTATLPSVLRTSPASGSARPSPMSILPNIAVPALHTGSPALSDVLLM